MLLRNKKVHLAGIKKKEIITPERSNGQELCIHLFIHTVQNFDISNSLLMQCPCYLVLPPFEKIAHYVKNISNVAMGCSI